MNKYLFYIYPIVAISIIITASCNRKQQSSEQEMKDSLTAANVMTCAKCLNDTLLHSDSEEHEEFVMFPAFKKSYPLENDLIDTFCTIVAANKDFDDIAITVLLQTYIEAKQIQLSQNPVDRYRCIDSIITNKLIPDPDLEENYGGQSQINESCYISKIWTEYLCYHYERLLEELLKKGSFSLSLQTEQEAFDKLLKAQINYFDSIGYSSGSASPMAYSQLGNEMYTIRLKGILDMYFALQVENYKPNKVYKPISNSIIKQEYDTIFHAIDTNSFYDYINSRKGLKLCLLNEQKAWNSLMKARKGTSRKLQGRIKSVYDNATYRLLRYHLIQLKNAFEGYGIMSDDVYSRLLSDTCSYDELLHSPNFVVKPVDN